MVNKKNKLFNLKIILFMSMFFLTLQCQTTTGQAVTSKNVKPESGKSKTYMRGLYIPNHHSRNIRFIKSLIAGRGDSGINMLVFDVHPYGSKILKVNSKIIEYLKSENIYTVARVVCFQDGINRLPVSAGEMKALTALVTSAADAGFDEVQLDYIRFVDDRRTYPLKKKYEVIEEMLKNFRMITEERKVKLSADVFGRIMYNRDDLIGQKLELFASHTDVIYPMLYPSHFNKDRKKMSEPGETVKDGAIKGIERLQGTNVSIQPYIQAFPYNIQYARVKLEKYVALQIKGVEETDARGWVAWNPNGDYSSVFRALNIIKSGMVMNNN